MLGTAGIPAVIEGAVVMVHAYLSGPFGADVAMAVGGAVAEHLADELGADAVVLVHRGLDKDVIAC
ncbi:hypothetical protein ACFVH6_32620 [Spirillospora sp. NPDC127200]